MSAINLKLFLAILPVFGILTYIYKKDREKEPIKLLLNFFVLGMSLCFVVLVISYILEQILPFMSENIETSLDMLLYIFIGVASVEELCKWVIVYFKGYNNSEFDESYDIIIYSVFTSLGFAFLENIIYIIGINSIETAFLRAIFAIPGHTCNAIFMGYYLSKAKDYQNMKDYKNEHKNIMLSMIVAILLHGIYDYCIMSENKVLLIFFIFFIITMYIISFNKINTMSKNIKKIKYKNNYCPNCGTKVVGYFCGNCGQKQE